MEIKILERTSLGTIYEQILISSANTPNTKPRSKREIKQFIHKLFNIEGHKSILEFFVISFVVNDISRLALEFLEHHRLASYNEMSFRRKKKELKFFNDIGIETKEDYKKAIARGLKSEDARAFLPLSLLSKVALTVNGRELWLMASRFAKSDLEEVRKMGLFFTQVIEDNLGVGVNFVDNWKPYIDIPKHFDFEIKRQSSIYFGKNFDRKNEFINYVITGNLSNYSIAQLRRHRIGTLILDYPDYTCQNDLYNCYKVKLGVKRSFIWQVNRRSLDNFFRLRLHKSAQKEIRDFAYKIKESL